MPTPEVALDHSDLGEPLLTPEAVARLTNLSVATVSRLAFKRRIPSIVIAHRLRFRREDIESWLRTAHRSRKRPVG